MPINHPCVEDIKIISSWKLDSGKSLSSMISLVDSTQSDVTLDNVVQIDTCVNLIQDKDSMDHNMCTLSLHLPEKTPHFLSRLVVVSEARFVELSGEQYLGTFTADYVDDFEGCAVYMADCAFKPSKQLLIKFQRTKHAGSLWIYGLNLTVLPEHAQHNSFSIDYHNVNDILQNSTLPISDKAEKCKLFLQSYYTGALGNGQQHSQNESLGAQNIMSLLQLEYFKPTNKNGEHTNSTQWLPNFLSSELNKVTESKDNHNERESDLSVLKSYIDKRFAQLEQRIDHFEEKLLAIEMNQNKKLDSIIALLSK